MKEVVYVRALDEELRLFKVHQWPKLVAQQALGGQDLIGDALECLGNMGCFAGGLPGGKILAGPYSTESQAKEAEVPNKSYDVVLCKGCMSQGSP